MGGPKLLQYGFLVCSQYIRSSFYLIAGILLLVIAAEETPNVFQAKARNNNLNMREIKSGSVKN